jgi:ADP-ribose pyrophosphatase YjhB (NUDIX family)
MKHENVIEILVRGVCIKDGKLLVCQSKGAGNTYLPGGHVEWQEKAEESLRREIKEELGLTARVGEFLGAVEHTFMQKGKRHCEINVVFLMDVAGVKPGRDPEACEDWIEFRWIPVRRLGANSLEPWPLRKLIPAWMRKAVGPRRWGSTL